MKKNIIIYFPSFERGGVIANLINFVNYLTSLNYDIYLISQSPKMDLFKNKKKIKIFEIPKYKFPFISTRIVTSFLSIIEILKIFFQTKRSDTLLFSFQSSILPIIVSKIFFRKVIIRNSEDSLDATRYADEYFLAVIVLFLKFIIYNFADGIITNSIKSKNSLEKILIRKKLVKLIYNPYLKKILKIKKNKKENIILSIGRLSKQKDFETLIKGFYIFQKFYRNYKLVIIGHGNYLKKLKKLTLELKLNKKVIFKGWISKTDKYFLNSKIFVLSSLYEGLPNVLIDAVNFEIPVISTKCGGAEDILTVQNGFFFKMKNSQDLGQKLREVIKNYKLHQKKIINSKKKIDRFKASSQSKMYLDYCCKFI